MTPNRFASFLRLCLFLILLAGVAFQPQSVAYAAAALTVTPITWNIIGLDSNNVNVGPNNFPVGARVCNTSTAGETLTGVSSSFILANTNPYISYRPGTNTSYSGYTLVAGACIDFYYEVQVTRTAAAYNTTEQYYITADSFETSAVSTPTPRELYVEHLVSQNRNAVTNIEYGTSLASLTAVAAGGTMSLMVGNTYYIKLTGFTATQGYEQLESFINISNTVFQINSVSTTYTAPAPTTTNRLYADACTWENDPNNPNYRSCLGVGKNGGNITVTYNVTILAGAGTTQTLNTLIYDFSGSSYHYNADFSTGARLASIIGPSSVEITKTFSPKAISPAGTSVLTFKLTNPTTETITGVNFTDSLQGGLKVASTPNVSYSACGAGTFSPAPVANATSLSFSNGTLAPNSICTITVTVTADTAADYPNTTSHLFINTSLDTGNSASDSLKVATASACVPGQTLATWTFPSGSSATAPAYTTKAGNVTTATASTTTTASTIDTNVGSPAPSWAGRNFPASGAVTGDTSPNFQFVIDTSKYSGVQVSLSYSRDSNWGGGSATTPTISVWSSTTGGAGSFSQIFTSTTFDTTFRSTGNLNAAATSTNLTYFRINAVGATNSNAFMQVDTVTFTGCLVPAPAPTIAKSFAPDPIIKGATSTLTFTITNTAVGNVAQTGIAFTDVLPDGLSVVSGTASACNGTNNLVTTAATRTIALTGGSLVAGGSCTFNVTVTGTAEGAYENITGFLSSNESGTSTSYATDTLTVIAPPNLEKSFSPSSILLNGTSTLQFTITNPNQGTTLTGIGFTDTLPPGLTAVDGSFNYCNGTLTITGGNSLTFTGGSVNANNTCIFSVPVAGTTAGPKPNTTSAITSTQGGNGNAASATLVVSNPQPLIGFLKQISTDGTNWVKYVGLIPTGDIYYRFTITNVGETTLNNISVTDPNVNVAACLPALPTSLAVGGSASCVVGPISISSTPSPNPFVNIATVTTSTYIPGTEGTSSAQYGTKSLTLDKTADRSTFFAAGEAITYSYLVTNSGGYPLLGPVTVTDDKVTVICPDVSTVGDNDNYLDPGENLTCTATYSVTAGDATAGRVTNNASALVDGVTSNTDSVTVTLPPDLIVTKTNNVSGSVALGNSFDWTITVTNAGVANAVFANGQTIVSDPLPAGATYNPILIMGGGTFSQLACTINSGTLACAANGGAVTLSEGASFSVTVTVTPTAAGSLSNTATVDLGGAVTELNETNNTSLNAVTVVASPLIEKQFVPEIIAVGNTTTLTFTISNTNTATSLTGVAFTDPLPTGLQVANPPNVSATGCGAPTFSPNAGDISITFSGGTILASSSCSVSVNVLATTSGTKNNTTGNVTATNGGTGNTASYPLYVFDSQPTKSLVNTSEASTGIVATPPRVAVGEMIRYRLAAQIPAGSFTNIQLLDGLPTGLQFLNDNTATVAFVCNGSVNCMTSSTLSGVGLVMSGSNSNVTPTFTVPGGAISGGPFGSGTDVTFSVGNITNSDADADAEYVVIEFNALVLNVNSGVTINQGVDNQTGASNTNNRQNDVTLQINGAIVGGPSANVTVAIAEPAITAITKSVTPAAGPYLPGDALTYMLAFSNNATGNNATTAFDIVLTDTFDANLALGVVNVSSSQATTCAGGTAFSTSTSAVGQLVTANITCLDPGSTVTVTVNTTISASTPSGTTIPNSASLTYTSLPGAQGNCATAPFSCSGVGASGSGTGERNGSSGPGADGTVLNNYAAASNTVAVAVNYGSITVIKDAVPDNAQDFSFSGGGTLTNFNFGGGFSLDDDADGTLPNTRTFTNLLPDQITLTEDLALGWVLTSLSCTDPDNGSSVLVANRTATIDLDAGENVSCTFTNTQIAPPVISKNFLPDPIFINGTSTLTFTLTNANNFIGLTGVEFTDPLPAGLQVAPTPNASTSAACGSPTFAPVAADTTLTFTGGTIPETATCTVTVDVVATTEGVKSNTTLNVTSTNGGTGNTASDTLTVTPRIDLSLDKQASNATPTVGSNVTFTLVVGNAGPSTATNITITDILPSGYTYVAASIAGGDSRDDTNPSTSGLTWTINSLPSGMTVNLTYSVTVLASGIYDNYAEITSHNEADSDSTPGNGSTTEDDDDTETVTPVAVVDLSLDKQVSSLTPNVGSTVAFTLVVANAGPSTATNIVLTDIVPSGYTYVATSIAGGDARDDSAPFSTGLTWTINSLASGTSVNLSYQVTVLATGVYDNYAEITSHAQSDSDSTPGNNSTTEDDDDTQTVNPNPVIDVSLDKQVSNAAPNVGSTVTFTLVVSNAGPSTANGILVIDALPSGYSYVPASMAGGDTRDDSNPAAPGLLWIVNSLAAGSSVNLSYQAVVLPIGIYDNYAQILDHNEIDIDSTPGDNSTTEDDDDTVAVTPISMVDLSLDKQVSNATPTVGSTITFTLVIANAGPSAATNVVVTDVVPDGYTYVATSITGGDTQNDAGPSSNGLAWTINSLASGASVSLTYQATVLATGTYDNYAEITSHTETDIDSTPNNGSTTEDDDDTETVTPVSSVDLSLDKQVSNVTPNVGGTVTFTLVVANAGPSAATNVTVTDVVPSGYTYNAASIAGGDARNDTNPSTTGLTWTINALASGASVSLTYDVTVLATGSYDNYAEITGQTETDVDSTPGNNSTTEDDDDIQTVTPVSVIDVSLDKQVSNAIPTVGSTVTFTLVIANGGPSTATNINVTDIVPSGYTYVAASIAGGNTRNDTNPSTTGLTWVINSLASGASVNLTYQVTVLATGTFDNYAEITSHTETDIDSTPGNTSTAEDDDDTQTVNPSAVIDLSLDKQVSTATPNVGDTITFTLVIANAGPSTATNIVVSDVVPNGYTYVAASITGGDTNNDTNPAVSGLTWTINALGSGASTNLTYQVTVLATGTYDNYAEITSHTETDIDSVPGNNSTTEDDDDTQNVSPGAVVDLSLDKQASNAAPNIGSPVTFTLTVANAGPSTATNVTVTDVIPSGYTYVTASITGGDARNDANPSTTGLTWTINSLASGASVNLTYQVTVLASGTYDNYAEITGHTEPDVDSAPGNASTTEDDDDTEIVIPGAVLVADPALSKTANPMQAAVGDTVTFTLTVTNAGNAPAPNVVVTDVLPAMFDVTAVNLSGSPLFGTSVNVTPAIGVGPAPYTVVVILGSNLSVNDVLTINIVTTVNSLGTPPINNTASVSTSAASDIPTNNSQMVSITVRPSDLTSSGANRPAVLPATGFAPGVETKLPEQPQDMSYAATGVLLEIPSLGVKIPIVGVPKKNGTWDVSWLGKQAGWLEGSAFPSWSGNSVLTSHVYDSKGLPGSFINLNELKYGDQIIVHAYGQKYVFQVQTNQVVAPNDTSAFKHEEKSWLTLITCKEYDERTSTYRKRVVVRAVLVKVLWDK